MAVDHQTSAVVVAIRGTHSRNDVLTDLAAVADSIPGLRISVRRLTEECCDRLNLYSSTWKIAIYSDALLPNMRNTS